ncbi:LOW QUALITY PROTEIN: hypothetical protein PoB_007063900 [Plakobranchus ocellatus]|uniref:Endonuclease-reverse transcriptase n=1 Tax=Plakobranchus ocellatus TaxID=259542 RepID=A0AAV4DIU2_9GAST|nr:LOW QUALITY PROTEIN: hypothetical protein PoB_007063900 [Plakobranchus ocellatus]
MGLGSATEGSLQISGRICYPLYISIETRKRALQCYIEPVLMYGCEAWTISKQIQNKLEATEMWFLRRMLWIPWTVKKTNERVLNEAIKRRSLVRTIRKRQATFILAAVKDRYLWRDMIANAYKQGT